MKRVLLYGSLGGVLIALLKYFEYKHFVHDYPTEIYGGLVAVIFSTLGIWFGRRLARSRQVVVVQEVRVPEGSPFELDSGKLKELGITQREHEILRLIAEGLSNRRSASGSSSPRTRSRPTRPACSASWGSTGGSRPSRKGASSA